jgi:hypothetical protein
VSLLNLEKMSSLQRRDFLKSTVAGLVAVSASPRGALMREIARQASPLDKGGPARVGAEKLARVSIMTYNFSSRLKLEGETPNLDRVLELFDVPQYFADTYGVHNVELQHSHFASTETSYLKDFRACIERTKSQMTQINVEFGPMTGSAADPVQRYQAIDLTTRWVDHAVVLNCPRVMVNQGLLTNETKSRVTAALRLMNEYANKRGVKITVETREPRNVAPTPGDNAASGIAPGLPLSAPNGPPSWELVRDTVEASGTWCNIDIGNITAPDQVSLHMVLKGLLPFTSGNIHIKVSPNWDLATAVRYANNDLGYEGLYSIEVNPSLIRGVYDTILANI